MLPSLAHPSRTPHPLERHLLGARLTPKAKPRCGCTAHHGSSARQAQCRAHGLAVAAPPIRALVSTASATCCSLPLKLRGTGLSSLGRMPVASQTAASSWVGDSKRGMGHSIGGSLPVGGGESDTGHRAQAVESCSRRYSLSLAGCLGTACEVLPSSTSSSSASRSMTSGTVAAMVAQNSQSMWKRKQQEGCRPDQGDLEIPVRMVAPPDPIGGTQGPAGAAGRGLGRVKIIKYDLTSSTGATTATTAHDHQEASNRSPWRKQRPRWYRKRRCLCGLRSRYGQHPVGRGPHRWST